MQILLTGIGNGAGRTNSEDVGTGWVSLQQEQRDGRVVDKSSGSYQPNGTPSPLENE